MIRHGVNESCIEFLFIEMVNTFSNLEYNEEILVDKKILSYENIESIGFRVGQGLMERFYSIIYYYIYYILYSIFYLYDQDI